MSILVKKVRVIDTTAKIDVVEDVLVDKQQIIIAPKRIAPGTMMINGSKKLLVPGLIDLHVHFREPGLNYKEDINSGISAALSGGVTSAMVMPNTSPVIDRPKDIVFQMSKARKAGFDLMVAAAATKGLCGEEASDAQALKRAGAIALTDDGRPIHSKSLMRTILKNCRRHKLLCMQHAEDLLISKGSPLNEGEASEKLGIKGQSHLAESSLVERDLNLVKDTFARYHVLHLSCRSSLNLIRKAKRQKLPVTAEVTPHHLMLCERHVLGMDPNKKMNPPLRTKDDVNALLSGLSDYTIDAVASDHAPHAVHEKNRGLIEAPFGVIGLETAFLVLLTLVKRGLISLNRAVELMTSGPARALGQEERKGTLIGEKTLKNAVLLDPNYNQIITPKSLKGRSQNSAFLGMNLFGRVLITFVNGKIAYKA